jgi:hypothetical protein
MSGPDAPAKPILYGTDTTEAEKARALLEPKWRSGPSSTKG